MNAVGLKLGNNYKLSVDTDAVTLSHTNLKRANKDEIILTARRHFDYAVLTLQKNKDVHTISLAWPEPAATPAPTAEPTATPEPEPDPELTDGLSINPADYLELSGKLPKHAVVDIVPVTVEIDGQRVLAAFDIKIYVNENQKKKGKTWQPADKKVTVRWKDDAFASDALNVYHLADGAAPEHVATVAAKDGWVEFEAGSFSVYAVSETILTKTITTSDGATYEIKVTYDQDTGLPMEGTALEVAEIRSEDEGYADYIEGSARKLGVDTDKLELARAFDIKIVDAEDSTKVLEPKGKVEVSITLVGSTLASYANVDVLHFAGGAKSVPTPSEMDTDVDGETVRFTTDSFSVYVVAAYTLEAIIEASDGNTYRITVTYGDNADIPMEGVELLVREIVPDSDEYRFYRDESIKALNTDSNHLALSRAFDIKIVDQADHTKTYEPKADVSVAIALLSASLTGYASVDVLHFAEDETSPDFTVEKMDSTVAENAVSFATDSFSVYAVAGAVHVATIHFHTLNEYLDYEDYELNTDTEHPVYVQIVRSGERPVAPQNPVNPQEQEATFSGWYRSDAGVTTLSDLGTTEHPATLFDFSSLMELDADIDIHLYAKFAHYYYVIFHDQYDQASETFPVAFTRRFDRDGQDASEWYVDLKQYSVAYEDPDNQDDTQMTFVGWSLTPVTQPGNPIDDYGDEVTFAPINDQGLYEVEGTVHMYPVFRWVKWLNFYTGPSGSHATYFTDTYYFADRGDSQTAGPAYAEGPVRLPGVEAYNENGLHYPAMTRDPDRQGRAYVFEGWYIGATEDQNGEVDITGATRVANADGTLIQGVDRDVFKYVATCDKNESPHFHFTNEFRYNENSNPQYRFTKEPITLYAHWTYATTASYSVVVSSLKAVSTNNPSAPHNQKSYEFAEKFIYTGNIGAEVAWNPAFETLNNYESFNALHPDAQLTLDTDVEEGGNQYHNPYFGYDLTAF